MAGKQETSRIMEQDVVRILKMEAIYMNVVMLPAPSGLLLDPLFQPEDGGKIFFQKVDLSENCTISKPKDRDLRSQSRENRKLNKFNILQHTRGHEVT
jgi:hypothetical protein